MYRENVKIFEPLSGFQDLIFIFIKSCFEDKGKSISITQ